MSFCQDDFSGIGRKIGRIPFFNLGVCYNREQPISYLESLNALVFCQKRLQMLRPWLVKLMTASSSQFFWIQTTSCESIFLRQGLQTIICALELMSSNSL